MRNVTKDTNLMTTMQVTEEVSNMLDMVRTYQNGKPKQKIVEEIAMILSRFHERFTMRTESNGVMDDLHDLFNDAKKEVKDEGKQRMVTLALRKVHSNKIRAVRLMYNLTASQLLKVLIPFYMNVRVFHGDEIGLTRTIADCSEFDEVDVEQMDRLITRFVRLAVATEMKKILDVVNIDADVYDEIVARIKEIDMDRYPDPEPVHTVPASQEINYDFT